MNNAIILSLCRITRKNNIFVVSNQLNLKAMEKNLESMQKNIDRLVLQLYNVQQFVVKITKENNARLEETKSPNISDIARNNKNVLYYNNLGIIEQLNKIIK